MSPTKLEIRTNALRRLLKEQRLYQEELEAEKQNLVTLKSSEVDEYNIKKQSLLVDESKQVLSELEDKIRQYRESLIELLDSDLQDEDTTEARSILERASAVEIC